MDVPVKTLIYPTSNLITSREQLLNWFADNSPNMLMNVLPNYNYQLLYLKKLMILLKPPNILDANINPQAR